MQRFPIALLMAFSFVPAAAPAADTADPHQWLEAIDGEKQLAWVRERNARYLPELESTPGFAEWRTKAQAILEDPRRIALPTGAGPSGVTQTQVFNFWRDATHVRGIWRVSPRAAYEAGRPEWRTLLDMDALDAAEGRNWQWGGANCLPPDFARCLVRLSVGGKDSVEVREFDTAGGRFVPAAERGFVLPDAKQQVEWLDRDTLLVATAAGPVTASGYAREVRRWARGTPFAMAPLVATAEATDMGMFPSAYGTGADRRAVIDRRVTFWSGKLLHVGADGTLQPTPLPDDADFRLISAAGGAPRAYALLRTAWRDFPAGALVAYPLAAAGPMPPSSVELVFAPQANQAITEVDATGEALYVNLLADVTSQLRRLVRIGNRWEAEGVALPANTTLTLVAADDGDTIFGSIAGFTEPARLVRSTAGREIVEIARAPAFFDGARFTVAQRFATSRDGTRVPYFIVRPRGAAGPLRTYLWSYGGFEVPLTPTYVAPDAQFWLEAGNQYVVANIRGGGEYGPRWHQAALLERRQNSYDDLHAVAEALKREGMASKVAVHGRSNGGLMASVAYTQRPDLYDAALVGVPLADMRRFHTLLAGASWMAEYGNPDTADWNFIRRYSPYQNLKREADYPRVFFYTSTKDDRVHPAHARKMAAEMERQGHPIYYYENVDGGHAGVANLRESAYRYALMLAYLTRELR
jgi:prolyl oligopeptidase